MAEKFVELFRAFKIYIGMITLERHWDLTAKKCIKKIKGNDCSIASIRPGCRIYVTYIAPDLTVRSDFKYDILMHFELSVLNRLKNSNIVFDSPNSMSYFHAYFYGYFHDNI